MRRGFGVGKWNCGESWVDLGWGWVDGVWMGFVVAIQIWESDQS